MSNYLIGKLNQRRLYSVVLILMAALVIIGSNVLFTTQIKAQSLPMKEQITQMVIRQARAWENQDAQAIADDFANSAVFIAASFEFQGKSRIKQAALDYFKGFHNTVVEIKRIIVDGNEGAVEWTWRDQNRKSGKEGYAEDAIIFKLENDKIVYWREYIEKKDPP